MKKILIYTFILIIILLVDISSKNIVNHTIRENESISIFGEIFKITLIYNYGTTFGLFKDSIPYITISIVKLISIFVLIVLLLNVSKIIINSKFQQYSKICIILIIGGSLGNIIDRLIDKRVTDFIDIGIVGHRWHIFNLADVFQSIGGLMILFLLICDSMKNNRINKSNNQVKA